MAVATTEDTEVIFIYTLIFLDIYSLSHLMDVSYGLVVAACGSMKMLFYVVDLMPDERPIIDCECNCCNAVPTHDPS